MGETTEDCESQYLPAATGGGRELTGRIKVVMAMSDQQLVTGLANFVSGYSQLPCGLSLYHWHIITATTWFASVTHLATLPFLQQYLRRHKYLLYIRVFLMTALTIMLAIALLSSGRGGSKKLMVHRYTFEFVHVPTSKLAAPATCFLDEVNFGFDGSPGSAVYIVVSEIILLGGLFVRLLRMLPATNAVAVATLKAVGALWRKTIAGCCGGLQKSPRRMRAVLVLPVVLSLAAMATAQAVVDFLRSATFEVLWLMFALIWGTIRLFTIRSFVPPDSNVVEEDFWGFGQLVPVLLLLLPILLIAESCSGRPAPSMYVSNEFGQQLQKWPARAARRSRQQQQ